MSKSRQFSGPQFSADREVEHEAPRATIVGGRPPGSGQRVGDIPRGIEVLVKKAAVDPEFKELLLARRAEAASEIDLQLKPAEILMLQATSAEQLEAIIDRTTVPTEHRRVFLGKAAAAMLGVLALSQVACSPTTSTTGIAPDPVRPGGARPDLPPDEGTSESDPPDGVEPSDGEQTDSTGSQSSTADKNQIVRGTRPDPPAPTGSRPDLP